MFASLEELPFNHITDEDAFYSALSELWYNYSAVDYEKLNNLKFNLFDTNVDTGTILPNHIHDPDVNCSLYKELTNDMLNSCNYYIEDTFTKTSKQFKAADLSLYHCNIRSLPNHISELNAHLLNLGHKFKFIGVSETWLNNNNSHLYSIDGYTNVHQVRNDKRGGGVSLFIDQDVKYKERFDLNEVMRDKTESVFIEVPKEEFQTKKKLIIGEMYRPPNLPIADFIYSLQELLRTIGDENAYCYLLGDFNINLLNVNKHNSVNELLDLMLSFSFIPLINRPTRVSEYSATIIDNIFTNVIELLGEERALSGILYCDISDHFPIYHIVKSNFSQRKRIDTVYRQIINESSLNRLKTELGKHDWSEIICCNDANKAFNKFMATFEYTYKTCIPTRKVKIKVSHKPWITNCLLNSIKQKNKLYVNYIKNPCHRTRETYKKYRNKLTHLLRISEKKYVNDYLCKYSNDLKKSWNLINNIINKNTKHAALPDSIITESGHCTNNDLEIANCFNRYFTSVGPNLANKISYNSTDPLKYMGQPSVMSMFLKTVRENELIEIFKSLKDGSAGPDSIKPKVLKTTIKELISPLTHLLNLSLKQGIFPEKLKVACITPIFKQGNKNEVGNYRPISVLSSLSKIFEKVMSNRLLNFLNTFNLLYKHQHGFRKGHSTDLALLKVTDYILKAFDEKQHAVGVFLDLKKAFDTIDHNIALRKLEYIGIRGPALNWFRSYLSHRLQFVKYKNTFSVKQEVMCGVPQGSILGPILFLIYINDLHKVCKDVTLVMFADDTSIFAKGSNPNDIISMLNNELENIAAWLRANRLSLNIGKTHFIVFSNCKLHVNRKVTIGGNELDQLKSTNFLGIKIDEKLSWKEHISFVTSRMSKCIGILYKARHLLSVNWRMTLYKTFVLPHLNYCNIVWSSTYPTYLKSVVVKQKLALKSALNVPLITSSESVFTQSKVHTLNGINRVQTGIFMYKYSHHLLPCDYDFECTTINKLHHYNTRSNDLYRLPRPRISRFKFSLLYKGPALWNNLPHSIKCASSLQVAKQLLKDYFM